MAGEVQVALSRPEVSEGASGGTENVANGAEGVDALKNASMALAPAVAFPRFVTSTDSATRRERPERMPAAGTGEMGT